MLRNPFRKAIVRVAASATPARGVWMSARAKNALQRPIFIGTVSVVTIIAALLGLIVVPQQAKRRASIIAPRADERVDTVSAIQALTLARAQQAGADSALASSRRVARELQGMAVDTTGPATAARRDSLTTALGLMGQLIERTENAPLPTSYRALAESGPLRDDPRVRALVDSLNAVEREREGFGSAGGVDPIFITLTSRMNEIGRSIQAVAEERRAQIRSTLAALMPTPLVPTAGQLAQADSIPRLAAADSAHRALRAAEVELTRRRRAAQVYDERVARAQELMRFSTPPLAILGAALVLGIVFGFASAFSDELRRPRLADVPEAERVTGLRAVGVVEMRRRSPERYRRQADKAAPPLIDPSRDGYQLVYMHVAADSSGPLVLTLTSDEPALASVVAANLAAISADEARHTLVVDTDAGACGVAAALQVRAEPGLVDVIDRHTSWTDATVSTTIGRSSMVDVMPSGISTPLPDVVEVSQLLQVETPRLLRQYDTVLVVASSEHAVNGLSAVLPVPDVLVCTRIGHTRIRELRESVEALRRAGANPIGMVVWNAEPPALPTPAELRSRRPQRTQEFAVAAKA